MGFFMLIFFKSCIQNLTISALISKNITYIMKYRIIGEKKESRMSTSIKKDAKRDLIITIVIVKEISNIST